MAQAERSEQSGGSSFSAEYKAEVVAWYLGSGKAIAEAASELNLSESMLREWIWYTSLDGTQAQQPPRVRQDADQSKARRSSRAARADERAAEALARAEAAAKAEVSVRAEAAAAREEARAAHATAVEAIAHSKVSAEAMAEAEASARAALEEIRAVYAAAVEGVVRAEVAAAERIAQAEAAAAKAVAEAEALAESEAVARLAAETAAHEEVAAAYASAMDAVVRAESLAAEALAQGRTVPTVVIAQSEVPFAVEAPKAAPAHIPFQVRSRAAGGPEDEAAARAEIAQLVARFAPVELWVHTTGRTLAEARAAALEQLGVDEGRAEIEVLFNRARWLPGRTQIRARVRIDEDAHP